MTELGVETVESGSEDTRTRTRTRGALRECGATTAPCVTNKIDEPELAGLLAEYNAGDRAPEEVELGELPQNATADMRLVANDVRLLIGLRLAAGDDRPLPYSARFAAGRIGWRDPRRASRALRKLCLAGVILDAGSLPPRGQPNGTKTYAPPSGPGAVEYAPVDVEGLERPAVQPTDEVEDQAAVGDAVTVLSVGHIVTSGNRTDGSISHATDGNGWQGRACPIFEDSPADVAPPADDDALERLLDSEFAVALEREREPDLDELRAGV